MWIHPEINLAAVHMQGSTCSNASYRVLHQEVTFFGWLASYCMNPPENVIQSQDKAKKWKYLQACLDNHQHFTLFVCSMDGLMGEEAKVVLKCLATCLAC